MYVQASQRQETKGVRRFLGGQKGLDKVWYLSPASPNRHDTRKPGLSGDLISGFPTPGMVSQRRRWLRECGAIKKSRSAGHSVEDSMGEPAFCVKLLFGLRRYLCVLSSNGTSPPQTWRMDPAGVEPASATMTECRVPFTLRALNGVSAVSGLPTRSVVTVVLVGFWIEATPGD